MASRRNVKDKRRRQREDEELPRELNTETLTAIRAVILIALATLCVLSIVNLLGDLGVILFRFMRLTFGWGYILLPIDLLLLGAMPLLPRGWRFSAINYVGLFFANICILGLLGLTQVEHLTPLAAVASFQGGGYLGLFIYPLHAAAGFWGAMIIAGALLIVALLLLFNTSLYRLFFVVTVPAKKLLGARAEHGTQNNEHTESDDEQDTIVSDEDEEERETENAEDGWERVSAPTVTLASGKPLVHMSTEDDSEQLEMPAMPPVKRNANYAVPSLDLLDDQKSKPTSGNIAEQQETIRRTFHNFGIDVEMADVQVGPTVTQFSLKPAEGVKVSQITALSNDLALALAAHPIRIEAPIPGKSLVGIEVPNQRVARVSLRDMLNTPEFRKRSTNLMMVLGKDVAGKPWLANIDTLPHVLIAGATGSGKTVCINAVILGLIYQNSPEELRFIMVDPKRVELPLYNGIPHLLTPVITEVTKTVNALRWTIGEMERRFDILSKKGKRNIQTYNRDTAEKLPYIVIVIDELADLMVAAGQEVEAAIIRLAQMSRAVGIHLILATQRPSVDVITGLIKANIPARVAFSVASLTDSRTILDSAGAEKLLGRGDMLFTSAELSKPKRLQGAFVSDDEIKHVVNFLKDQGLPDYNESITQKPKTGSSVATGAEWDDGESDEMLDEARDTVVRAQKASASYLQRKLKVGYARAARLLDLLEEEGTIGPGDGAKPRDVLLKSIEDATIETDNMPENDA